MKKVLFPLIAAAIVVLATASCESSKHNPSEQEQTGEVYTCPMHPEVIANKPGLCPKCGMDLVKKAPSEHMHDSIQKDSAAKM